MESSSSTSSKISRCFARYFASFLIRKFLSANCGNVGSPLKSGVQFIVVMSITEAGYMTLDEAAKEALWLTGLVKELGIE
jgi:hypothetical protein